MNPRTITIALLIVTVIVWVLWDVYAALNNAPNDTITHILRVYTRQHPVIPLGIGIVLGHLFWGGSE